MTLWDLQIPYEPRYSFDEQVVTDPGKIDERRGLAAAYRALVLGIAAVAPGATSLARLSPSAGGAAEAREPVETRYDPTTRFAGPDVYVSSSPDLDGFAKQAVQARGPGRPHRGRAAAQGIGGGGARHAFRHRSAAGREGRPRPGGPRSHPVGAAN
jgi:hypothetical protein